MSDRLPNIDVYNYLHFDIYGQFIPNHLNMPHYKHGCHWCNSRNVFITDIGGAIRIWNLPFSTRFMENKSGYYSVHGQASARHNVSMKLCEQFSIRNSALADTKFGKQVSDKF